MKILTIDPRGRRTVAAGSDLCFYTGCVRLSVLKIQNQAKITAGLPSESLMTAVLFWTEFVKMSLAPPPWFFSLLLIHEAGPKSRPVVIIVFAHNVRPHLLKQNKFQAKTMFTTGETVGLAEWIIDDICLVVFFCTTRNLRRQVTTKRNCL